VLRIALALGHELESDPPWMYPWRLDERMPPWEERARLAEAESAAWKAEARAMGSRDAALGHLQHANAARAAYEQSISWLITRPLRTLGRIALRVRPEGTP